MCGLVGYWDTNGASLEVVETMADRIAHRGPDDFGSWLSDCKEFAIAHRRLAVIDLSPAGHQPMLSRCGRYVLAFNGEIYNHIELRNELFSLNSEIVWRGHSDTETLVEAIVHWGVEQALKLAVGMFAVALWDRREQHLVLARDRAGEKPLYYGFNRGKFLFGSELKSLTALPGFSGEIDRGSLALLVRQNCIPAPHSIYSGIKKLQPGNFVSIDAECMRQGALPPERVYWSYNDAVEVGLSDPFSGTQIEAVDLLQQQLLQSTGAQMGSDVPLGAFLSGGIDSSLIVSLMQAQSTVPIKTFTIGFNSEGFDEAKNALEVARHLGTEHTELYVNPSDSLTLIPRLAQVYCEPFSDSSQIPTYLVSEMAKKHVTVALSGDGGDELFGGYNRYLSAPAVWSRSKRIPSALRKGASRILRSVAPGTIDSTYNAIAKFLPSQLLVRTPGEKAHKMAGVMLAKTEQEVYRFLVSTGYDSSEIVIGNQSASTLLDQPESWPRTSNFVEWMMAMDGQSYMPDDILVKVDRAAMANSLETRVPFLDHRVIELAWKYPTALKIGGGKGKLLLRQVLDRYVPREMYDRPKMGFAIPLHEWLRGPLREWAEALLNETSLRDDGFFHVAPVRALWNRHLSGQVNAEPALWSVLMFQAWLAEHRSTVSTG